MTREQARQNLEAIIHWANGGNLWYKKSNANDFAIYTICDMVFDSSEDYIIEDQFFEQRKAFALGKKIEYYDELDGKWARTLKPSWHERLKYRVVPTPWYEDKRNIGKAIMCKGVAYSFMKFVPDDDYPIRVGGICFKTEDCRLLTQDDLAKEYTDDN